MKNKAQLIIILFLFFNATFFYNCRSAKDIQTLLITRDMESVNKQSDTFDIETYNKNKGEFGLYKTTTNDITIIYNYDDYSKEYYEIVKNTNLLYNDCKYYYLNGKLKEKGSLYKNRTFRIGTWYYYDEAGNLTKTIDYDAKSKITWKKALEIAYQKYGYKPKDVVLSDKDSYWMIRCEEGKHAGKGVDIDKNKGKTKPFTFQYAP